VPVQQPLGFMDADLVKGIDVSHLQNVVDWARVAAAGVQFCYVKATEGEGLKDVRFPENWDGAQAAGLIRGAYHFFRPGKDAEAQAESFLHVVPSLSAGDLPPVLDVEVAGPSSASILDGIQTWVEAVENVLGRQPIIYTYPSFWTQSLGGSTRFSGYLLWVAHYTFKAAPTLPRGFNDYVLWQFSEQGHIDGITGNVDLNRFHGSHDDLNALAWR